MSEITKGPWRLSGADNKDGDLIVFSGKQIVTWPEEEDVPRVKAVANARAISAVPELIEACELMLVADWNETPIAFIEAKRAANAALKKARGE